MSLVANLRLHALSEHPCPPSYLIEAADRIVALEAERDRLAAALAHADLWTSFCPCDETICLRAAGSTDSSTP